MPRQGIDFSTVTRAERWCAALGLAMFANTLVPYWYRVHTPHRTFVHNGGLYGWGILAAVIGFTAAAITVTRHVRTPPAYGDRSLYVMLGGVATVTLAYHGVRASHIIAAGFWVELALALALAVTGVVRMRERARGWV